MRKTFISLVAGSLLLTACAKSGDVSIKASVHDTDAPHQAEVVKAVDRVLGRFAQSLEVKIQNKSMDVTPDGAVFHLTLSDEKMTQPFADRVLGKFSFRIMRKAETSEKPDVTVERGGYMETGLTEKEVAWVTGGSDPVTQAGTILIQFTPAGAEKFRALLTQHKGEIAIFVRSVLVSTFSNPGEAKDSITISGVPSPTLAEIFADDVNVGVHATLTEAK